MELTARFQSQPDQTDGPITFSLQCRDLDVDAGPFIFANPLTDKQLNELNWYLEQYWRWPTGPDYARAHKLESEMQPLGARLWSSLFDEADAVRAAQQFLDAGEELKILTIDSVDPRVLRLPWELLADEDGHVFNASPPIVVRRRMHRVKQARQVQFDLPLRVLMVISRPDGVGFLDPRSSAEALLDALAPLGELAAVEFLRPPTVKALSERLTDATQPPVHVVHFDGHGVYDPNVGLGYLLFENEEQGQDPVNANRLGTLLNRADIPLIVLDACQTGEAGELSAFTGVAARLIKSGVGSVLAMNYSVLVETTRRLTAAFYRGLAQGSTIGQALDQARFDLLADTGRHRLYRPDSDHEETIQLHDWFLPSLYQQQADPAPFAAALAAGTLSSLPPDSGSTDTGSTHAVSTDPLPRLPARGGFPAQPRHGFHGRARELLDVERRFAAGPQGGRRILVLHGFGGQGKTALGVQAAAWLQRTGLFARCVFLSLEQGGGLELALSEIGHALLGEDFNIHDGDPVENVAAALAATPTLLVWDNFESVLPNGDAALPPAELTALLDAGARWTGQGGSRLLVTTRDTGFGHAAFEPGVGCAHLPLAGLIGAEALELAGQILGDRGIDRPPRPALLDLLRFLGGHPLSLHLVLPHLDDAGIRGDVPRLIDEFERLLPGFSEGKAVERNESLAVSLDFSLRRLGAETRALLPALGVFQGGGMESTILQLTEFSYPQWLAVRAELQAAALLAVDDAVGLGIRQQGSGGYTAHFIKFHPTLAPYLAAQLDDERRAALHERFRHAYQQLGTYVYHNDAKDPIPTRGLAVRELPNLRRALALHLHADDFDAAVQLSNQIAYFLDSFGRWRERDAMMAQVTGWQGKKGTGEEGEELTQAEFTLASRQGETMLDQGRAGEAERVFRGLLARMDAGAAYDTSYYRCLTLTRLGRSLADQGRVGEAEAVYRQEVASLAGLAQSYAVRRQTAAAHTGLADALRDQGRYAEARAEYEVALEIAEALSSKRGAAVVRGQLGTLALTQNDLAEARGRFQEALASFRALGEESMESASWHKLGAVAQVSRDWAGAERCYRESLTINERIGNKAGAAQTCNQLAIVSENDGRPAQAERWYIRTLEYVELLPDQGAGVYNNLAGLLLTVYQGPDGARPALAGAEEYALKALALKEQLGLSSSPWNTQSILAQIAARKGDDAAARAWRCKEQESFAAFPGAWANLAQQYGQFVQAAADAAQGVLEAKTAVEQALPAMTEGGYMLEQPIRRIWAGERDVWALTEELDREEALIVRKILEAIDGGGDAASAPSASSASAAAPAGAPAGAPTGGQEQGISVAQLIGIVAAACQGDEQAEMMAQALVQGLQQPAQPAEMQALGTALGRLLAGQRDRDAVLAGLPAALSEIVDGVLAQL